MLICSFKKNYCTILYLDCTESLSCGHSTHLFLHCDRGGLHLKDRLGLAPRANTKALALLTNIVFSKIVDLLLYT